MHIVIYYAYCSNYTYLPFHACIPALHLHCEYKAHISYSLYILCILQIFAGQYCADYLYYVNCAYIIYTVYTYNKNIYMYCVNCT